MKWKNPIAKTASNIRKIFNPFAVLAVFFLFGCILAGKLVLRVSSYPELTDFLNRDHSMIITDREGAILRILPLKDGLRREPVSLSILPEEASSIFIAFEDRRFFSHAGVDGFAVVRSFFLNRKAGRTVTGASTITMQLADIIRPHDQSMKGKFLEAWDALRLEARFSKKEIFELWLGAIPFGKQAEGIGSGSRTYFNKPVSNLSPAELSLLAVIPRHPEKYNLLTNPRNTVSAASLARRRLSLEISENELESAAATAEEGVYIFHAPHFVRQIEKQIEKQNELLFSPKAGGVITTALDLKVQQYLHERLYTYIKRHQGSRISGGAGVVLDNHTGEVLAYVGSLDFFSGREGEQIDSVMVERQPGSCLKPFLYAAALEEGWFPNMLLPDIPMEFGGHEIYTPMNFNNAYSGPVRFRVALASSLNIPSVYLLEQVGSDAFGEYLRTAGIGVSGEELLLAGLGAALGNLEVSLFELTRGFALFPRSGVPLSINWLKYSEGDYEPDGRADGLTDGGFPHDGPSYTADLICDILSDPAARAQGFGYNEVFTLPFPVMFKTGTSNQFQNIWALAATPDYTVGVWMGNTSGETVVGRTGSSLPARVAADVLRFIQKGGPSFPTPCNSVRVPICSVSGMRATPNCPVPIDEYLPETQAQKGVLGPCDFHIMRDGKIITRYPQVYHSWLSELDRSEDILFSSSSELEIFHPRDRAIYYIDPGVAVDDQAIRVEVLAGQEGAVSLYVNTELISTKNSPPFVWFIPLREGRWTLQALAGSAGSVGSVGDEVTIDVR